MSRARKHKAKPKSGPHSQRELARRLGVDAATVNDAIARGQLAACITYVKGKPKIRNLDTAVAEWRANRRPRADDEQDEHAQKHSDDRGSYPDYQVSRAKREYHLAEIAEVEARSVTGGEWLPVSKFAELVAKYDEMIRDAVRNLRARLPISVMRRCDLITLAQLCAEHGARTKHTCGVPLPPISDPAAVFRLAMHEVERAVDEVCSQMADEFEAAEHAADAQDDEDDEDAVPA